MASAEKTFEEFLSNLKAQNRPMALEEAKSLAKGSEPILAFMNSLSNLQALVNAEIEKNLAQLGNTEFLKNRPTTPQANAAAQNKRHPTLGTSDGAAPNVVNVRPLTTDQVVDALVQNSNDPEIKNTLTNLFKLRMQQSGTAHKDEEKLKQQLAMQLSRKIAPPRPQGM